MTAPTITSMTDAADVSATLDARLDAIHELTEHLGGRPIPYPRWKVFKHRIGAALAERAATEGRSQDAILTSEIEAAVVLGASAALAAGARAFVDTYNRVLRIEVAATVLDALIGDSRHEFRELSDERPDLDIDPQEFAHAEHLLKRLPELAKLTDREASALALSLQKGDLTPAERKAASRAKSKIQGSIHPDDFFFDDPSQNTPPAGM